MAQDRFIVKVPIGYPSPQHELKVLELPHRGTTTEVIGEVNPEWLVNETFYRAIMNMGVGCWKVGS